MQIQHKKLRILMRHIIKDSRPRQFRDSISASLGTYGMCVTAVLMLMIDAFLDATGRKEEMRLKAPRTLISKPAHQSSGSDAAME